VHVIYSKGFDDEPNIRRALEQHHRSELSPPPDLPSMLLHNRVVFIGMPLSAAVAELIIAQLLYLNYESAERPVYFYINSPGSENTDRSIVGTFEAEAFAIADVMSYIRPPSVTVGLGQVWGSAAMLLSHGDVGRRYALPNASLLLRCPVSSATGTVSDLTIRAREGLQVERNMCELISRNTRRPYGQVVEDYRKGKFLSPEEAVDYGLIDKVLTSEKELSYLPAFVREMRKNTMSSTELEHPPRENEKRDPVDLFKTCDE